MIRVLRFFRGRRYPWWHLHRWRVSLQLYQGVFRCRKCGFLEHKGIGCIDKVYGKHYTRVGDDNAEQHT